jgi:hypothetical protein
MQNQKSVRRAPLTSLGFPSPHALLETADHYSIVMNLLDTPSRRIGIRVDRQRLGQMFAMLLLLLQPRRPELEQ